MSERPEGAEIVRIRRKRGKKGDIIAHHSEFVLSAGDLLVVPSPPKQR